MSKALVLRVCNPDGSSRNGFKWPLTAGAVVTALDWDEVAECGNGLHGWLYGHGDYSASNVELTTAVWLVVEVNFEEVVILNGKCKFESGVVRFSGDRKSATDYLCENEVRSRMAAVIGACRADLTDKASVFVGALGQATSGYCGTSTSGVGGTSTSGDDGTSTSGEGGTSTSGYCGTSTSGVGGVLNILFYNGKSFVRKIAAVGKGGIKPNVAYKLDEKGNFVEVAK